jgi:hypothetical protein
MAGCAEAWGPNGTVASHGARSARPRAARRNVRRRLGGDVEEGPSAVSAVRAAAATRPRSACADRRGAHLRAGNLPLAPRARRTLWDQVDGKTGRFLFFVPLTLIPLALALLASGKRPALSYATTALILLAGVPRLCDVYGGVQGSRDGQRALPRQLASPLIVCVGATDCRRGRVRRAPRSGCHRRPQIGRASLDGPLLKP